MSMIEPASADGGGQVGGRARRTSWPPLLAFFTILLLLVASAVIWGVLPRLSRQKSLLAAIDGAEEKRPVVNVVSAGAATGRSELELPGDIQSLVETPVYARADGYLSKRLVDYGDRVKAGQVLAELESPELDQQLRQARANLAQSQAAFQQHQAGLKQSEANLEVAQFTYERWKKLTSSGLMPRQETDEKKGTLEARRADVQAAKQAILAAQETANANEANVQRLLELKSFDKISSPFDGVVTARNVDLGQLVAAGTSRELFRIAQIRTLRIFVNIPQANLSSTKPGTLAEVRVDEMPGKVFQAKVTRNASALDPRSHTMATILELPNSGAVLLPGMYARVKFAVSRNTPAIVIPGEAVLLSKSGPRVAVVSSDNRVHFHNIEIAHDYGSMIEVNSGLKEGDLVVVNPGDEVKEDAAVEIHSPLK